MEYLNRKEKKKDFIWYAAIIAMGIMLASIGALVSGCVTTNSPTIKIETFKQPDNLIIDNNLSYFVINDYIDGTLSSKLWKAINILKHEKINILNIYMNSGGGVVFDGLAVADLIRTSINDGMHIYINVSGIVASAAVPILAACEKGHRIATEGTIFMLHNPGKNSVGDEAEMTEVIIERYSKIVNSGSKLLPKDVKDKCDAYTWFTAEQALHWGLIDKIE
jgi:ATP-dependent protease ClpP protease subunit